ncbi:MAG: AIM24 family protein, partial [Solirubrobacterales bacterium]
MSVEASLKQFAETESTESFSLQNSKCLKVELAGETIQAKLGSMVAYQGDVNFEHAGSGGLARMAKKAMTGEGATLMKISGSGEV